jgi:hypothetical protein
MTVALGLSAALREASALPRLARAGRGACPQEAGMTPRKFSRDHDERVLAFVRARAAGDSLPVIAARFGVGVSSVQMATGAVIAADLAESGEPRVVVLSKYWSVQ